jgi:hypothetical protein
MYRFKAGSKHESELVANLLGSGTIMNETLKLPKFWKRNTTYPLMFTVLQATKN